MRPDDPTPGEKNPPPAAEKARGWLRHGNPPGDLGSVARCGAKTRQESLCQQPAMHNGRCRLHGGKSTGPKTAAGKARQQQVVTKHGGYRKESLMEAREIRSLMREYNRMVREMNAVLGKQSQQSQRSQSQPGE